MQHGLCILARAHANIVALNRTDKCFGRSIALWTFDWRRSRFETDVTSEAAGLAGDVTAAIVGQPLDGDRQAIGPKRCSTCDHQVVARKLMALRSAIEREDDPHLGKCDGSGAISATRLYQLQVIAKSDDFYPYRSL